MERDLEEKGKEFEEDNPESSLPPPIQEKIQEGARDYFTLKWWW